MSTLRDYHVFKDSILMGPHMSAGGRHAIGGYVPGVYMGAEAAMTMNVLQVWTPLAITTQFWIDASDENTLVTSGSSVTQWRDKSGNSRHPSLFGDPQYASHSVVCTSDYFNIPPEAFPGVGYAIIALFASSSTGTSGSGFININSSPNDDPEIRIGDGSLIRAYFNSGYAINMDGGCLTMGIVNIDVESGVKSTVYRNGSQLGTGTVSGALSGISEFRIGHYSRIGYRNGSLCEIFVYPVGADNRQNAEGYIAHKWDAILGGSALRDALPANHPYKYAPPTA